MNIYTQEMSFNMDTHTPVGLFLSLRNQFSKIALLESNDYHDRTDSKSFIGFNPLAEIRIHNNCLFIFVNEVIFSEKTLDSSSDIVQLLSQSFSNFKETDKTDFNGFYGALSFEFSNFLETKLTRKVSDLDFPDFQFYFFEYLFVLDHFSNTGKLIQNSYTKGFKANFYPLEIIKRPVGTSLYFEKIGNEVALEDEHDFLEKIEIAKAHCQRGDVFQLVLSRPFSQNYFGDDFEIYRTLRTLNPSPYLYYMDFETHRIIGSSPEAQLKTKGKKAEVHPIAGTVKKSGDPIVDQASIDFLIKDEKENAEHTMLVDLARNDLSKSCSKVKVQSFKEVQHFSHVIHLVSKVVAEIDDDKTGMQLFADTFPAGTLSGTPKPKALELIKRYEGTTRDYYGGAIGFIGFDFSINMAIIIRSILSKNNCLHYRAGAGVVLTSNTISELKEVDNKLGAVRMAIHVAEEKSIKIKNNSYENHSH